MKALITSAKSGSPDAVALLSERLNDRVRGIAAKYTRTTSEEFDDLLQEAWAGLLEALPEVNVNIGAPEEYLIKRARWRVLDYLKYQRRRQCEALPESPLGEPGDTPGEEAVHAAVLGELFGRLTDTQRRVVLLLLNGLTWREAAAELGCASSNVAYHVKIIRRAYVAVQGDCPQLLAA